MASGCEAARRLVEAGAVTVNGAVAERVARLVHPGDALEVLVRPRFVSRGGEKLDGALDALGVAVAGRRCIDVGASTGGFTDCLLQRGAVRVVALDVGRAQLHERLRASPAVQCLEGVSVRHLGPADVGGPADVVSADLSFISLRLVMGHLAALTKPGGDLIVLVKPQFEARRSEASSGRGVIRLPEVWRRVVIEVAQAATAAGLLPQAVVVADPPGAQGNAEFFLHCRRPPEPTPDSGSDIGGGEPVAAGEAAGADATDAVEVAAVGAATATTSVADTSVADTSVADTSEADTATADTSEATTPEAATAEAGGASPVGTVGTENSVALFVARLEVAVQAAADRALDE